MPSFGMWSRNILGEGGGVRWRCIVRITIERERGGAGERGGGSVAGGKGGGNHDGNVMIRSYLICTVRQGVDEGKPWRTNREIGRK